MVMGGDGTVFLTNLVRSVLYLKVARPFSGISGMPHRPLYGVVSISFPRDIGIVVCFKDSEPMSDIYPASCMMRTSNRSTSDRSTT